MQFTDVTSEYLKCHFCGMGIRRDISYLDSRDGNLYHTRECFEFSKEYENLKARLETEAEDRASGKNKTKIPIV